MSSSLDPNLYKDKPIPIRYDLVFQLEDDKPVFVLSASRELIREISEIPADAAYIKGLQEDFHEIGEFSNSDEMLGFGGVFAPCEPLLPLEGFSIWKADVCEEVLGDIGESNWAPAYQLSCSLSVILRMMEFAESSPNSLGLNQLAILISICRGDMGGFGLAATLSPIARNWIAANRSKSKEVAQLAMIATYRHMWPDYFEEDEDFRLHSFQVYDNSQGGTGLVMDVPGNACGIYVDGSDLNKGPGWDIHSHNVDSPIQQLSLLSGLCAILRLVRESQLINLK